LFLSGLIASAQTSDASAKIISALRSGNYSEAKRLAGAALQASPNDARLLTLNGWALVRLGEGAQALIAYKHALQISPDYLPALEGAAEVEYKNGSQAAVPLLERIVKGRPDDKTSHAMLAELAFKRGDCNTAIDEFRSSEPLIDSQVTALQGYGSCLVKLNRPQDAIPIFERISKMQPGEERARYNLAVTQSLAGRYADVIQTLSPIAAGASDPDALDLLAEAYEANSDTPRAVETLRRAILADPDKARYYLDFADICMVHASYKVGIDMVDAGLKRLPHSAPLYLARGILYVQLGQYNESERDFAKAEQLDPTAQPGMAARSMAALQENDLAKAEATVRDRIRKRPNDAFLHYLLAETLARRGAVPGSREFSEAVESAGKAIQLQTNFGLARDLLGRLYLKEDNISGAIEQSRLAVRADPTDQTALYHLIVALTKGNQKQEIPKLTKQLAELREQARRKEANERKYALVEQGAAATAGNQ
jgi:tetratricopeptide (TPR) repeat protein